MLPAVGIAVVAGAIKAGPIVWVAGIATDPLAEHGRKEFLERAESVLAKFEQLEMAQNTEQVPSLKRDLAVLRAKVPEGWPEWPDFCAACRVANFVLWYRTQGSASGIYNLAGDGLERLNSTLEAHREEFFASLDKTITNWVEQLFNVNRPQTQKWWE